MATLPDAVNTKDYEVVKTAKDLLDYVPMVNYYKAFMEFVGYWREANPLARAVALLQEDVAKIKQELAAMNMRLNELAERIAQLENLNRLEAFQDVREGIAEVVLALAEQPPDAYDRYLLALRAGNLADRFLPDGDGDVSDLWKWTDTGIKVPRDSYGNPVDEVVEPLPAGFKTRAALPLYVLSAMGWLAAIELATGGSSTEVQKRYGEQLRRHVQAVTARPDWNELEQPPRTLPEQIRARITCRAVPRETYARNGECRFTIVCDNVMDRTVTTVGGEIVVQMNAPGAICTAAPDMGLHEERVAEDEQGVATLSALETALRRVERTGTLREQQAQFPATVAHNLLYLYTVDADGRLEWRKQGPTQRRDMPGEWEGPRHVGEHWGSFLSVLPAGGNSFYSLQPDGRLLWYRHDGFADGHYRWTGPVPMKPSTSWSRFDRIVAGSDGVLYTIAPDGVLEWHRHLGFKDGGDKWAGPEPVGTSWQAFKAVFSVGDGVIYAVKSDGTLLWYRHRGFLTGERAWEGPKNVHDGWQSFAHIFTVGFDGIIYAIRPDGVLIWYKHEAWEHGHWPYLSPEWPPSWRGPVEFGSGLAGYRHVFAYMSPTPPGIP